MSAERSAQVSMNGGNCGIDQATARGINTSGINQSMNASGENARGTMPNQMDARTLSMLIWNTVNDELFQNFASEYSHKKIESLVLQLLTPTIVKIAQDHVDYFIPNNLLTIMQGLAVKGLLPGAVNCTCPDERRNAGLINETQNMLDSQQSDESQPQQLPLGDGCFVCGNYCDPNDLENIVECSRCKCLYHRNCVKIEENNPNPWVCDYCLYNLPSNLSARIKAIRGICQLAINPNAMEGHNVLPSGPSTGFAIAPPQRFGDGGNPQYQRTGQGAINPNAMAGRNVLPSAPSTGFAFAPPQRSGDGGNSQNQSLNGNMRNNGMPGGNPGAPLNSTRDNVNPIEGAQNISNRGFNASGSSASSNGTEISPVTQMLINDPLFRAHLARLCEGVTQGLLQNTIRDVVSDTAPSILSGRMNEIVPGLAQDVISRGLVPFVLPCKCQPEAGQNAANEQCRDRSCSPIRFPSPNP